MELKMLVYCDYIADRIRKALVSAKEDVFAAIPLSDVGRVKYDLSETGYFQSTKKTLEVVDGNGKVYLVTVEQIA
jgi:hypothetical protein